MKLMYVMFPGDFFLSVIIIIIIFLGGGNYEWVTNISTLQTFNVRGMIMPCNKKSK